MTQQEQRLIEGVITAVLVRRLRNGTLDRQEANEIQVDLFREIRTCLAPQPASPGSHSHVRQPCADVSCGLEATHTWRNTPVCSYHFGAMASVLVPRDRPAGEQTCPECQGSGQVVLFAYPSTCKGCGGSGRT